MKTTFQVALLALAASVLVFPRAQAAPEVEPSLVAAAAYRVGESREALRAIETLVAEATRDAALQKRLEAGLAKLLGGDAAFEVKRFACKHLAVLGTDASLPAIAGLLNHEDTAGIACLALSTQPSAKAGETLRKALSTAPGSAQLQIVNTLANRKDAQAVSAISALVALADPSVADAAIAALGRIASPEACDQLARWRKESPPAQRLVVLEASLQAAGGLAQADDKKAAATLYNQLLDPGMPKTVRRAALAGLLRTDRDGGEQRIFVVLGTLEPDLKPTAIAAIPALKSGTASAKFAGEMARLEPAEQALLVEALAARSDDVARAALLNSLNSREAVVRRAGLIAVAGMNDPATVPAMVNLLLAAPQPEEKQMAEQALIGLGGGARTEAAILEELASAPEGAKASLINVVGRRGNHDAFAALLAQTANTATAEAAFQSLARISTGTDLEAILDALVHLKVPAARGAAENAAGQTLAKVADPAVRSAALRQALASAGDAEGRGSVLRLLPAAGDAGVFALLQPALTDANARVKEAANRALADWPNATAWDALAARYQQPENESQRVLALRALVRLAGDLNAAPDAALVARYRQLLDGAKNDNDRKLILGALGGAAHPDALALAVPLLGNAGVRAEAELAVKKIAEAIKTKHPQAAQEALQKLNR